MSLESRMNPSVPRDTLTQALEGEAGAKAAGRIMEIIARELGIH